MISSEEQDNSYIAPTSFGKSSLIIDVIENLKLKKVIFHDEMYDNEDRFIAVFTQERALRLLKDESISFDALIIDEAHNLFDSSSRSILLSRLIRKNKIRNTKSKIFYFSPLITDSNNLKTDDMSL